MEGTGLIIVNIFFNGTHYDIAKKPQMFHTNNSIQLFCLGYIIKQNRIIIFLQT